jgi:hypothetical protein
MRSILKGMLVMLVSTLSIGVLAAEAASAHTWTKNGVPITKATAVKGKATLKFEERDNSGESYECGIMQKAAVDGAKGEITSITSTAGSNVISCAQVHHAAAYPCGATAKIEVEAGDLPWDTELVTGAGSELRDTIKAGGKGSPYWHIKCESTANTCAYEAGTSTGMKNLAGVGVEALFDAKSELGTCTVGGAGDLAITGSEVIALEVPFVLGAS